ncbi:hypothetical protein A6R68_13962 [Neotoma lepida]|uniref:Uncharacterized protein n=1 Tax=Neotoma lepida TaxID=56216 RepID=A0A1A6GZ87_NEOLE|nr:hypothetical protein A6R68_13962 [Neotoma lepida]
MFATENNGRESETPSSDAQDRHLVIVRLRVTSTDYLLGMANSTGTLVVISTGNVYAGFPFSGNAGLCVVFRKLYTLRESLAKMENDFCALKV